ncbi:MAG: hypothetical protein H6Q12_509 [Bacteroidetes bacterium]|nr:hypothetical protein [Bacteroidota bacterium]
MKKRILIILIISIFPFLAQGQDIDHNSKLADLINTGRWIDTKEYLLEHKDQITDFMQLLGSSMVNTFTNNPSEAVQNINSLINKYESQIGDQILQFYGLLLNNYDELQEYDKSVEICDKILKLDGLYQDLINGTIQRKEWCRKRVQWPKLVVNSSNKKSTILNFKKSQNSSGILFKILCNNNRLNAIFDTGSSVTCLNKDIASRIGVRYVNDTILLNKTAKAQTGIIDSISLGEYTIYNFPVVVYIDSIENQQYQTEYKIMQAKKSLEEFDIILGMSFLKLFEEIQLDNRNQKICFSGKSTEVKERIRMQLVNNSLYIKVLINDCNFIGLFDTGLNLDLLINNAFYAQHKNNFINPNNINSRKQILRLNGREELKGVIPANITVNLCNRRLNPSNSLILADTRYGYDGIIGDFVLKESDFIVFNFKDMWFYCK